LLVSGHASRPVLVELTPGVGYEVKVAQAVTFRYYSAASASDGRRMLATGKQ